jgi:hypothetical protein
VHQAIFEECVQVREFWAYDRKRGSQVTFLLDMESPVTQAVTHENVISIFDYSQGLEDPRSTANRKHLPGDLIVISVCGVLAGADGPKAIGV